jgi:hypothetical protein
MKAVKAVNLFSLLCIAVLTLNTRCAQHCFPERIASLSLMGVIDGADAQREVDKLHMKEIPLKNVWIATYGDEKGNTATVWISESTDREKAVFQTKLMMKKMWHNPHNPYSHLEIKESGERTYIFRGMGQQHAVFQRGKRIYWISTSPGVFDPVLKSFQQ